MANEEVGVSIDGHIGTVELKRGPNNFLDVDLIDRFLREKWGF